MSYVTVEKDGAAWMLCHTVEDDDIERQVAAAKAEAPAATFTHRLSTPIEAQHCADAMDAQKGAAEDTLSFFAVKVSDLAA